MRPNEHVVPPDAGGERLVDHVRERLAVVSARRVGPLIADGHVLVDGRAGRIADPVRAGQTLTVGPAAVTSLLTRREALVPEPLPLKVVYEDDALVVVDKAAGMHVHPMGPYRTGTLVNGLLWHAGARPDRPWAAWRPYPGHRLDRPTSGLLAVIKRRDLRERFQQLLELDQVARTYHAWVSGAVTDDAGTVDAPLGPDPDDPYRRTIVAASDGGQPAITHWRVVERRADASLLEVRLETGRTHQIRAHLASLGHPVAGDRLYGAAGSAAPDISLRAMRLAFPHPATGEHLEIEAHGP